MSKRLTFRILIVLGIIIILLGIIAGVSCYQSKYSLSVTYYTCCSDKLSSKLRIVQLTDLHNSSFGPGNEKLLQLIREQQPDMIFITGDMLNSYEEETDIAVNLVQALTEVAPVYYSMGNHEVEYMETHGEELMQLLADAGATVLELNYLDLVYGENRLRIGGFYGYGLPAGLQDREDGPEQHFLQEFQDTDACTLLLTHMPAAWICWDSLEYWEVDYIFSGHAHGGQIIIPLIGGLYAPDQGYFPGRCQGIFSSSDDASQLILSRGLGTSRGIPRINNIPEILVADLVPVN